VSWTFQPATVASILGSGAAQASRPKAIWLADLSLWRSRRPGRAILGWIYGRSGSLERRRIGPEGAGKGTEMTSRRRGATSASGRGDIAAFGRRLSGRRTQVAFLGEIKRTIPWSRPASGGAPRTGLVEDAACGTGAQRRLVLDETEPGAILSKLGHQSISPKAAVLWGQLPGRCRPIGQQRSCCDDRWKPPSIPRSSSVAAAAMQACAPRLGPGERARRLSTSR
jgi:hypothetical protein